MTEFHRISHSIGFSHRVLHIDRLTDTNQWRLWVAYDKDLSHGSYYLLHSNGMMEFVTVREGEGDEIVLIKPEDK